jgi:hypothetical protein
MKQTISKDIPLSEITLRRYEKPKFSDRELIRKLCLSLGLLQPGDSRDVIVDVLHILLKAKKEKQMLHSEEIKNKVIEQRKQLNLPMLGIASSNVRRQLKRLKDLYLIENQANTYRITEFSELSETFNEKIKNFHLNSILNRVHEYFQKVDEEYK